MIDGERMFTVEDIAKYLRVSEVTVRRMIADDDPGEHLPVIQVGALLRIREEDLEEWIRRHRR